MAVLRRDNDQQLSAYLDAKIKAQTQMAISQAMLAGMKGPKGDAGVRGEPGPPGKETYMLSYCGIHVKVPLDKSTFDLIDDATELNGDDLQLIKMVNEQDWKTIREAWADQWQKNKAYAAFEEGFPSGEYL